MRRQVAAAGLLLAVVAGCSDDDTVDQEPEAAASATPSGVAGQVLPSQLVGQWDVEGAGVEPGTVLTLSAENSQAVVFLDCGLLDGSWSASRGGPFLADFYGGSGNCPMAYGKVAPEWMDRAAAFDVRGDQRELRALDGSVVATLHPAAERPDLPDGVIDDYADPPVLTEPDRAKLDRPLPAFPDGIRPAESSDLLGTWVRPTEKYARDNWPHVTFDDDGRWIGSDGCNGLGSRWALSDGAFLRGYGATTAIGCENIDLVSNAVLAGFDGETLVFFDRDGKQTHRLVKGRAPKRA